VSAHGVPRVSWHELGPEILATWGWPDGRFTPEHMSVYGKSRSGKSYLIGTLVDARNRERGSHVVYLATKKTDQTIEDIGWPIVSEWPPNYDQTAVIFWARPKDLSPESRRAQRAKVAKLLDQLWSAKGRPIIIVWDEITYVLQSLQLKVQVETFLREGASHGITNVMGMQRAAGQDRLVHSESSWTAAFRTKDADDRRRLAEILGDRALYQEVLNDLDPRLHEHLWVYDRTGDAYITHVPWRRDSRQGHGVSSR
jgi:hypothetical protein